MISDKTKMLCLIAFTLTAGGCGGGADSSGDAELTVPPILVDDAVDTADNSVITATEMTEGTETSDAVATPVASVSSGQMDAFVENPLFAVVPSELTGGTSTGLPSTYITNPLLN